MLILRFILSLLILPAFICPPQAFAQVASSPKSGMMLYQKVLMIAEKKADLVSRALPPGNVMLVKAEKDQAVRNELKTRMTQLETASNEEVAEFKKTLLKVNEQELSEMGRELRGYLNAMTEAEVAALGEALKSNPQYQDQSLEFSSAFTSNEKKHAIVAALQNDLSFLRSVYNKKLGKSTKEELKKDLAKNLSVFDRTQSNKADNKKILQISLIVLAGVALATWGISSAVYGARLSRVRSDREAKLAELQKNLNSQYQAYQEQLTQEELDYLKKNGYIRMVCGTFDQRDSILCNRYDYKLFSGEKHCSIYCYKNVATGKETLHEPAVCTSPFIPTDCYDPQEYWDAYARGEDDGYDDGYDIGYSDGDDDGYDDGRSHGADDGYDDGYSDGYSEGYDDGYDSGYSSSMKHKFIPFSKPQGYLRGYKDGIEQYKILFLNF